MPSLRKDVYFVRGNLDAGPTSISPEGRKLYEALQQQARVMDSIIQAKNWAKQELSDLRLITDDTAMMCRRSSQDEYLDAQKQEDGCLEVIAWLNLALKETLRECRRTIREMERLGKSQVMVRDHFWLKPREHNQHVQAV